MSVWDRIDRSGDRPTIPPEELEDFPASFIPPLAHYYRINIFSFHGYPSHAGCQGCNRTSCEACYSHCPYCGGQLGDSVKKSRTEGD